MKKVLAVILAFIMIFTTSCGGRTDKQAKDVVDGETSHDVVAEDFESTGLGDPKLLSYVQDNVYATLEQELQSDDYIVEQVQTIYISKEYLDELEYNSKPNIYFGYTLDEIEEQFSGERYVFTLGEDGTTVVQKFEAYDDTHEKFIRDVAIGAGVILVCVTVSVASGGLGLPAVSMVFAASAKTGTVMALSSGAIAGVAAGVTTGIQTGDLKEATKAAESAAGEGFKWGAITGVITGGVSEAVTLRNAEAATDVSESVVSTSNKIPDYRESELRALEKFGGEEQLSYLNGEQVPIGTPNATRPDIVRETKNGLEAIEVKNYNLANPNNRNTLYSEVKRQVAARVENMPEGTLQRIVLDTKGRDFSKDIINLVKNGLQECCSDVYPNLPITVMR